MSENKIFRKVSLDRLSSPEELDQRLTVTSPKGWLSLLAIAILLAAALVWGFFGSIADKATGSGMILSSGGINSIIHHANGQITDVSISDGDYVQKGQVIARIEQPDLIKEINQYKADLEAANAIDLDTLQLNNSMLNYNVYGKIAEIYSDFESAGARLETQRSYYNAQREQNLAELEQARIQYDQSLDKYQKYKVLYENEALSHSEFIAAERDWEISTLTYELKQRNLNEISRSDLQQAEAAYETQKKWLRDTIIVSKIDLQNQIDKKQQDLLNNGEVIASVSGRVLEMKVKKGDLIQAGAPICSIAQDDGTVKSLEAVIYVPAEQGKKITPGMEVNVCPSTVNKEESGFMLGNVVAVSKYPASAQGMLLTLGNNELVQQLHGENSPIEVKVELVMDNSTVSGYRWSTPKGPDLIIDEGTICIGEVKVAQKRPASMIVPFIKKILPI